MYYRRHRVGICLALADRLDTLVGIFAIDQAPTGSKDPFSLRRSAIGILRILIEKQLPINLVALVEQAIKGYSDAEGSKIAKMGDTFTQVMAFLNSRYRAMYTEQGVSVDTIQAVQAINPHMPLDFDQRIRAVQAFSELSQASMLADSNKRVANILAKSEMRLLIRLMRRYCLSLLSKIYMQMCSKHRQGYTIAGASGLYASIANAGELR